MAAEVNYNTGEFISSSWGRKFDGKYYVIIIGLGDVALTIWEKHSSSENNLMQFEKKVGRYAKGGPFYEFVEETNRNLMESEKLGGGVPSTEAVRFRAPKKQVIHVTSSRVGKIVKCPRCGRRIPAQKLESHIRKLHAVISAGRIISNRLSELQQDLYGD